MRFRGFRVGWFGFAVIGLLVTTLSPAADAASVSPSRLKVDLLTKKDLGHGWSGPSSVEATMTKDTWTPSTCFTYSTEYGGPYVRAYYSGGIGAYGNIEEQLMIPTSSAKAVFQMMRRCGQPVGVLPEAKGAPVRLIPAQPISLFEGLGQASEGSFSYPVADQHVRSVDGIVVKGPYLIFFGYIGPASLPQIHRWAVEAVSKVPSGLP